MTLSQNVACKRLSAIGLKQSEVHQILHLVNKWIRNEGPENTIKRLKQIKVAFLHKLAGKEPDLRWLKHKNGIISGPLKPLFRMANKRQIQRSLSGLMVYSDLVSTKTTPKQLEKFWNAVERQPSKDEVDFIYESCGDILSLDWNFPSLMKPRVFSLDDFTPRRGPTKGCTKSKEYTPADLQWVTDPLQQKLVSLRVKDHPNFFATAPSDQPEPVGRIGYIQEPGFKLRCIANPIPTVNWALQSYQQGLLDFIAKIPEDCTHDQDRGVYWANQQLKDGASVSSVDLSNATDLFPLPIQHTVLMLIDKHNHYETDLEYFLQTAKSEWFDPESKSFRKWVIGQGQGLAPSFPSFGISHHIMMRLTIYFVDNDISALDLSKDTGKYRIVGDDIDMLTRYESTYKSLMRSLGCEISEDKTITSTQLAEFVSKVITPDAIYTQPKFKEMSDRNFLDIAKNLGRQSIGLLRPRQRRIVNIVAPLPYPYGLGWNPKGESLRNRVLKFRSMIKTLTSDEEFKQVRKNHARYDPLIIKDQPIYNEDGSLFKFRRINSSPSDQEGFNTLADEIEDNFNIHELVGTTLKLGFKYGSEVKDPRGKTALQILEKQLDRYLDEEEPTNEVSSTTPNSANTDSGQMKSKIDYSILLNR